MKKPDATGKERHGRCRRQPPGGHGAIWADRGCLHRSFKPLRTDSDAPLALIHRLLTEQALGQWKRYAVAFALMAIAAGATALSAYLIGDVINAAYVDKNLPGIIVACA